MGWQLLVRLADLHTNTKSAMLSTKHFTLPCAKLSAIRVHCVSNRNQKKERRLCRLQKIITGCVHIPTMFFNLNQFRWYIHAYAEDDDNRSTKWLHMTSVELGTENIGLIGMQSETPLPRACYDPVHRGGCGKNARPHFRSAIPKIKISQYN